MSFIWLMSLFKFPRFPILLFPPSFPLFYFSLLPLGCLLSFYWSVTYQLSEGRGKNALARGEQPCMLNLA